MSGSKFGLRHLVAAVCDLLDLWIVSFQFCGCSTVIVDEMASGKESNGYDLRKGKERSQKDKAKKKGMLERTMSRPSPRQKAE